MIQNQLEGGEDALIDQPTTSGGAGIPREIASGTYWFPINKPCEIDGCGAPAYHLCDYAAYSFKGCGRAMCMDHCHVATVFKRNSGNFKLNGYNCIGQDEASCQCKQNVEKMQAEVRRRNRMLPFICCCLICLAVFGIPVLVFIM